MILAYDHMGNPLHEGDTVFCKFFEYGEVAHEKTFTLKYSANMFACIFIAQNGIPYTYLQMIKEFCTYSFEMVKIEN